MKPLPYLLILLLFIACETKQVNKQVLEDWKDEIKPVQSSKLMQKIDSGTYQLFFGKDSGGLAIVPTFYLDETAVTNAEYLTFLKSNPQWTKSRVLHIFADSTYLSKWKSDYEIPANADPNAPVTNVSWFAAKAYAKSVGKRLPTVDEWEFAALASRDAKNGKGTPEYDNYLMKSYLNRGMYLKPVKQSPANFYGIYDMFGVIWEWTEDFNSVMITNDSRNNASDENLFCAGSSNSTSDLRNYAAFIRYAMRGSVKANYCINNYGFRCAKDVETSKK